MPRQLSRGDGTGGKALGRETRSPWLLALAHALPLIALPPLPCNQPTLTLHRGDVVQVETWFQEDGKLAAQRDWVLTDATSGRMLGRATSTWVMINMQTRRLIKLPEVAREKCAAFQRTPAQHAIAREQTRQKLPDLDLPAEVGLMGRGAGGRPLGRAAAFSSLPRHAAMAGITRLWTAAACLPAACLAAPHPAHRRPSRPLPPASPARPQIVGPIQVARRSDMDMNGHVNNVTYFAWAMETVPRDIYDACHLYQARVAARGQGGRAAGRSRLR